MTVYPGFCPNHKPCNLIQVQTPETAIQFPGESNQTPRWWNMGIV